MTLKAEGSETRLQSASRRLAESRALLAQHSAELMLLRLAGHCVREALAVHDKLREQVAQSQRDLIWAQDRIRFGLDPAGIVLASVSETSGIAGGAHSGAPEQAAPAIRNENSTSKGGTRRQAA